MGDKLIQGKTLLMRDVIWLGALVIQGVVMYMTTATTANNAWDLSRENKAFGMAREKQIISIEKSTKEYARDYAYRKDMEQNKYIEKNTDSIHEIREENIETRVSLSHVVKNQEKIIELLGQKQNK